MSLTISLDPVLGRLGPLQVTWHGLFTALALLAGLGLAVRLARGWDLPRRRFLVAAWWGIAGGIIGARLLHIIDAWDVYAADPMRILLIGDGGMALYGAILGGSAVAAIAARRGGLPLGTVADAGALGLLLGQAIGRIGDVIDGEHRALPTTFPWGVRYTHPDAVGQPGLVHPVAAYELIWDLLLLVGLLLWGRRLPVAGMRYWAYLGLYSLGRFFLGFLMLDRRWLWELRQAQLVAFITLAVAAVMLVRLARSRPAVATPGPRRGRSTRQRTAPAGRSGRRYRRGAAPEPGGLEFLTAGGGAFLAYFVAEVALAAQPHPLHWVAALVVGALGYGGGRLWIAWQQR